MVDKDLAMAYRPSLLVIGGQGLTTIYTNF